MAVFLYISLVLFSRINFSETKITENSLRTSEKWAFMDRFCFIGGIGKVTWEITYTVKSEGNETDEQPFKIVSYPDELWGEVYTNPLLTCQEKVNMTEFIDSGTVKTITSSNRYSGCTQKASGSSITITCRSGITFGANYEKWRYIVLSSCNSTKGLHVSYQLNMTNNQQGDVFFTHFSADEFYILQTDIALLVTYTGFIFIVSYVAWALIKLNFFHKTFQIFISSVMLQLLALAVQVGYWADYGVTGRPKQAVRYIGRFLEFTGTVTFVILLILLGKGYTVTRQRLRPMGIVKLIVLSVLYIAATLAMFIWEVESFDPAQVLYIYDSVPGYTLIAIRLVAWLWFLYAIFFTLKTYVEKRLFYTPLIVIYTIWFWAEPIMVFVAVENIPKWTREKVVNGINLFIIFLGHLAFLAITWPSKANQNFPYHVTTKQVEPASNDIADRGVVELSDISESRQNIFATDLTSTVQKVNLDAFPHETSDYVVRRLNAMDEL